ncbi:MAG: SDR family oxidoreductase [Dehalococcoidia bacterium]
MANIVVAGATGYLGRFMVAELARRGHRVRALARPGKRVEAAAEIFEAEATRPETLRGLCEGADLVFSSLGITRQTDGLTFEDVDYHANANVLAEAISAGVQRFGFVSVVSPEVFAGSALVRARERFVAELVRAPIPATVIRSTGFFNDIEEPFEMARKGRVFLVGDGSARINPIHGADLAYACAEALDAGEATRSVGGPETLTWDEVAALAFRVLDKPRRVTHVPGWTVAAVLPALRLVNRRAYDIATFVRTVMTHDIVGSPTGTHRLEDYFLELAQKGAHA